jgi:dihydroneopterin aldolase
VLGTHGALPEERERAQPFEVDLDVEADLAVAGRSDALADTIDYSAVAAAAAGVMAGEHAELLERLAQRIADAVLTSAAAATAVTVTVRKLHPPVPFDLASAAVTVTRSR